VSSGEHRGDDQLSAQHFLYFLPEPHGHGSLRPTFFLGTRVLGLVMEHYNNVARTLMKRPDRYSPLFSVDTSNGDILWELWIEGFEKAVALHPAAWTKPIETIFYASMIKPTPRADPFLIRQTEPGSRRSLGFNLQHWTSFSATSARRERLSPDGCQLKGLRYSAGLSCQALPAPLPIRAQHGASSVTLGGHPQLSLGCTRGRDTM
jgi:hypothetical protein